MEYSPSWDVLCVNGKCEHLRNQELAADDDDGVNAEGDSASNVQQM